MRHFNSSMDHCWTVILLVLVSIITRAQCYVQFTSPAAVQNYDMINPTYKAGETIEVQWESNYTTFGLYLCQNLGDNAPDFLYPIQVNMSTNQHTWKASLENITFRKPEGEFRWLYFAVNAYADNEDGDWNYTLYFDVDTTTNSLSAGAAAGIAVGSMAAGTLIVVGLLIWRYLSDIRAFQGWKKIQQDTERSITITLDGARSESYLLGDVDKRSTFAPSMVSPGLAPPGFTVSRPTSSYQPNEIYEAP